MTETVPAGPASAPAPTITVTAGPAPAVAALDAEIAANIETAKARVHGLGHDLHVVARWLVATTRGAVADVEAAIAAIRSHI